MYLATPSFIVEGSVPLRRSAGACQGLKERKCKPNYTFYADANSSVSAVGGRALVGFNAKATQKPYEPRPREGGRVDSPPRSDEPINNGARSASKYRL